MSFSTNKSSDLSPIYHYRSGFMKTRSKLGVKLFRLKAGDSQPSGCCCVRKPNGAFVKEGWDSPIPWLPADTSPGPKDLSPRGVGESQRKTYLSIKLVIFFAGQLGRPCRADLGTDNQSATHKQGWWVGCVVTDCL